MSEIIKEKFNEFVKELPSVVAGFGIRLILAVIVLIVGLKVSKKGVKFIAHSAPFKKLNTSVEVFLTSVMKVLFYSAVIICVAGIIGIPATSFVTILASAGVAIGLALQGSLSNVAGSIMILLFHPFGVGDYIEASGVSGTVEDINTFYTVIVTPDNKTITCPNGALSNENIVNYSAKDTRRVDLVFSVSYNSDAEKVKKIISDIIDANPLALKTPTPLIAMCAHNASSVDFTAKVWCNRKDYWTLNFELLEDVKRAFDKEGIEIPFPQMDVHVKNK